MMQRRVQRVSNMSNMMCFRPRMTARRWRYVAAVAGLFFFSPASPDPNFPDRDKPDIDIYALMSGKCPTLKIAGRNFPCKAVGYFHSEKGRANFTVAVDDPADGSHIVAFSGEYGHRTK